MKDIRYAFFLLIFNCCSLKERNQYEKILGKWMGHKTIILYDGDTVRTNNNDLQQIFFQDSMYWGFTKAKGYEIFDYSLSRDYLIINEEPLELLELSDSTLIYKAKRSIPKKFVIDIFRKVEGNEW